MMDFMEHVLPPFVICAGTIGNFLSICVYSRQAFDRDAIGTLYAILTAADLVNVLQLTYYAYHIEELSQLICKITSYASFLMPATCSWLLVAVTLERYCAIRYRTRFGYARTKKAKFTIGVLVLIFQSAVYSPVFIFSDLVPTNNTSNMSHNDGYNFFNLLLLRI